VCVIGIATRSELNIASHLFMNTESIQSHAFMKLMMIKQKSWQNKTRNAVFNCLDDMCDKYAYGSHIAYLLYY
jgi:hypothetical protein